MYPKTQQYRNVFHKAVSGLVLLCFFSTTAVEASFTQEILLLPAPGTMVHLSPDYTPPLLKAVKVHPDNPFAFNFIIDIGNDRLTDSDLKKESSQLIRYFLASLTTPENDMWVNLSPHEESRIIPDSFGVTEMGRDLLAQDYLLKQIAATLMYPEEDIGRKFWEKVHQQIFKRFGMSNLPIDTFNKVWIVPEKAVVYENGLTAYVSETHLKVMLEEDYLSLGDPAQKNPQANQTMNQLGLQIIRDIILPELEREVNNGRNFAPLRQIYNSLILANWYKKRLKNSILTKLYVDRNKVSGVDINDKTQADQIYKQYLAAFKKGVYNYIKEDYDPGNRETIPRKYFSGGMGFTTSSLLTEIRHGLPAQSHRPITALREISAQFQLSHQKRSAPASTADIKAPFAPERIELLNSNTQARIDAASSAISQIKKNIFKISLVALLATLTNPTAAVSDSTARIYRDDEQMNRQPLLTIPQSARILDVNLTQMLTDFKPKYAAINPNPTALWLKHIINRAKTFDEFSSQVKQALNHEQNAGKKAKMQTEFLQAFYIFIYSNTTYDSQGIQERYLATWWLKSPIEGNPNYPGAPRTLVCQNASELATILLVREFGFDENAVSIPEIIINFRGENMQQQNEHVAVLITLADDQVIIFDLTQGVDGEYNIDIDHRVLYLFDQNGQKKQIDLSQEKDRSKALRGWHGDQIDKLEDFRTVAAGLLELFSKQKSAQEFQKAKLYSQSIQVYQHMLDEIERLLKFQIVTSDRMILMNPGIIHQNLLALQSQINELMSHLNRSQNDQAMQNGLEAIAKFSAGIRHTERMIRQGQAHIASERLKKIVSLAHNYLNKNKPSFSKVRSEDVDFIVQGKPIGGEFIINELKKIIDRGNDNIKFLQTRVLSGNRDSASSGVTFNVLNMLSRNERIHSIIQESGLNLTQYPGGIQALYQYGVNIAHGKFRPVEGVSEDIFLPKFIDDMFTQALELSDGDPQSTQIVFLKAGAEPLYDAAKLMAQIQGRFPVRQLKSIWATMGHYKEIHYDKGQAILFIKYLVDAQILTPETKHLLIVDTDTGYDDLGTALVFAKTLFDDDIIRNANQRFNLNIQPFNDSETDTTLDFLYMYSDYVENPDKWRLHLMRDRIPFDIERKLSASVHSYNSKKNTQMQQYISVLWGVIDQFVKVSAVSDRFFISKKTGRVRVTKKPAYNQDYDHEGILKMARAVQDTGLLMGILDVMEAQGYDVSKKAEEFIVSLQKTFKTSGLSQRDINTAKQRARTSAALKTDQQDSVGGINFSADKTHLEVLGKNPPEPFDFDPLPMQNIKIDGLVPVILNITPVVNLPLFLSQSPAKESNTLLSHIN